MKNLTMSALRLLFTVPFMALALPACSSNAEAVCEAKCDCEGCSAATLNDCYFEAEDKTRESENNGCIGHYEELKACENDTGFCKSDFTWETSCKAEKERYDNCKK